jgi:hypothetical protein
MVNKSLRLAFDLGLLVVGLFILVTCVHAMTRMNRDVAPESEYMGDTWAIEDYITPTSTPTPTVTPVV